MAKATSQKALTASETAVKVISISTAEAAGIRKEKDKYFA